MRKVIVFLVIGLIVVVVIGGVFMQMSGAMKGQGEKNAADRATVDRGDLVLKVVDTGTLDAVKSVDVRSRASGRLKSQLVDEGDHVSSGQLIAVIDPLEIELRVAQDRAQLRGASSGVARTGIEIEQRRVTARAAFDQAVARRDQLRQELNAQPTLTRTGITQAEAALKSAQHERERLLNSTQPNQRTAADSELADATNAFQTAERDYNRIRDLSLKGYVSTQTLDAAKLRLDSSKIRLDKAKLDRARLDSQQRLEKMRADEDVDSAQAAYDRSLANRIQDAVKKSEYESAVAAVDSARAALRDVEVLKQGREQGRATVDQLQNVLDDSLRQLRETQVRAPMDGVVSKRYIEVGDMVAGLSAFSQGTAIFRVEDRRQLRVRLDINEIDVARLKMGMSATVEIDAFPGKSYTGKVNKIAPASNSLQASQQAAADAVVKYQVEVVLDQTDPELRSGMSAKCTFETLNRKNVLRLPIEFLGNDKDGNFVMLAPPKGSKSEAKRTAVQIGAKTGAYVEILSGVKVGDVVARPKFTGPPRKGFMEGPGDEQNQDQGNDQGGDAKGGSAKVEVKTD